MRSSTVVLNPLGGSRAAFRIPATASVSAGEVVSLRKTDETARRGMMALITSARLAGGTPEETAGTLDVLASFEVAAIDPVPLRVEYGAYWCEPARPELLAQYYGRVPMLKTSAAGEIEPILQMGTLQQNPNVPVSFSAAGFSKHTAMFAQSGSGKSYALGVMLEELISHTTARIIVIDPNGDFSRIAEVRSDGFWVAAAKERYAQEISRIPVFSPSSLRDAEGLIDDVIENRHRGGIFDLNRVEVLLWQKVVWVILKRLWRSRDAKVPTLIFIDESHHFAPASPNADDESPLRELGRIAAEGRKYGLWLVLATQRPQKLDGNIISQCDNLIVMKLTSRADTEYISQVYNGISPEMLDLAYGFSQGDAIAVGRIIKSPTLFRFRRRNTLEGGADLNYDWASPRDLGGVTHASSDARTRPPER